MDRLKRRVRVYISPPLVSTAAVAAALFIIHHASGNGTAAQMMPNASFTDNALGTSHYVLTLSSEEPIAYGTGIAAVYGSAFDNVDNASNYSMPATITTTFYEFSNATEASNGVRSMLASYNCMQKAYTYNSAAQGIKSPTHEYNVYSAAAASNSLLAYNNGTYANFDMPVFQYSSMGASGKYAISVNTAGYTSSLPQNASMRILKAIIIGIGG